MRVTYIELLGEQHPMCFSWAASEELDEAFGGMDNMAKELDCGEASRVLNAADKVLQILLKAGRIYAGALGQELPKPLPCRPADVLDVTSKDALRQIMSAISGDSEREVEVEPKNGMAAPAEQAERGSTTAEREQD